MNCNNTWLPVHMWWLLRVYADHSLDPYSHRPWHSRRCEHHNVRCKITNHIARIKRASSQIRLKNPNHPLQQFMCAAYSFLNYWWNCVRAVHDGFNLAMLSPGIRSYCGHRNEYGNGSNWPEMKHANEVWAYSQVMCACSPLPLSHFLSCLPNTEKSHPILRQSFQFYFIPTPAVYLLDRGHDYAWCVQINSRIWKDGRME